MRQYFSRILFCGILFSAPLSILSTDCDGGLKDGCKRCKGDGYEGCRYGTVQPVFQCGTGMTCIKSGDGCAVQCIHGTSAQVPSAVQSPANAPVSAPKSSAVAPSAVAPGSCSTGNKGEAVPDGCGYCMGKSLHMKCISGQWQSPKSCSTGEVCKGGLSQNNKVSCDGRCEKS